MPIPVVICDDSSFARQQIARSLPRGWDVSVTFAASGPEALDAIRAGNGDILFLDLTMPEMDGFDVLEVIRREDLPALTIVVSGDVQSGSRARVAQLGAVAFLKKPVDPQELRRVLDEYGVLGVPTAAPVVADSHFEFVDWCQEIANVAMGRAADLLGKVTSETTELSVPKAHLLSLAELQMLAAGLVAEGSHSYVSQGFIGAGISGETVIVFYNADAAALARLLRYGDTSERPALGELLMDMNNLLVGAFLKSLSILLDVKFSLGHPRLWTHDGSRPAVVGGEGEAESKVLTIEIGYTLGPARIRCDQLLMVTEQSITSLRERAAIAMEAS
jgi:CheY-like chemotaxis protein